jgi:branched-chain amino acid transport system permease protein
MGSSEKRSRAVFDFSKILTPTGLCIAALIAIACVLPPFFGSYYHFVAGLALINVIIVIGLNILTGNAGQISLCQASFMAIGAYSTTYFCTQFGINYWIALPFGGLFSALCGVLVGFPALRLRGFHLAVATLGFLEFSQILIENIPSITGGVRGLSSPRPSIFGTKLSSDLYFYYVILAIALVSVWCAVSLLKSPTGRAFNAIRNSEAAAQTLGVPLARTKLIAFVIAAFYAGIGGGLYASLVGFIDPLEFSLLTSLNHIIFITVGGLGSVAGSVIGAIVFVILPELLRGFKEYKDFVFGTILLLTLIFMPTGIVGLGQIFRRYWGRMTTRRAPATDGQHG